MTNHVSWHDRINNLFSDPIFALSLKQIQAKSMLHELKQDTSQILWKYDVQTLTRNLAAASYGIESISFENALPLIEKKIIRQLAIAWESLAKLEEGFDRISSLMNSAIMYELAGYQANAVCLARLIHNNIQNPQDQMLEFLTSSFIQRLLIQHRFDNLEYRKGTHPKELDQPFTINNLILYYSEALFTLSDYFLTGNEKSYEHGYNLVASSLEMFNNIGALKESNLVFGILSLLEVMKTRSTWSIIGNAISSNERWKRYLKLLARGTGANILKSISISELWPSQIDALEKGLLSIDGNKVVRMPTSAGKTRTAEMAIAFMLINEPESKCIYVAPYRALVAEIESSFLRFFNDLGFSVSSIVGSYESDELERILAESSDLLVITPEKLDLVLRARPEFLERVRLIVLDEVQIIHQKDRGIKFEILMTRIMKRIPQAKFILLSAVIANDTLEHLAYWLKSQPEKDVLESKWRPSIQRFGYMTWSGIHGQIQYVVTPIDDAPQEFVPRVISQDTYTHLYAPTGRTRNPKFPSSKNKSEIAAELALKLGEVGPVLVFCSTKPFARAVGNAFLRRIEITQLSGKPLPSCIVNSRNTKSYQVASNWLGNSHPVTKLLSYGIALHHRDIPDIVKSAIEYDFRNLNLGIIVATSTLAQGVNLPIRNVIIHSCWRSDKEGNRQRLPAREYWNIAGRAGRPGRETTGNIIHIVKSNVDRNDFNYYLEHQFDIEATNSALFDLLEDLVKERISEEQACQFLDSEVLALLVEEDGPFIEETFSMEFLKSTLVSSETRNSEYDIKPLQRVIAKQANTILNQIPDPTYLGVYSSTGLGTTSCEIIRENILANESEFKHFLSECTNDDVIEFAELCRTALMDINEMKIELRFNVNLTELIRVWMKGTRMSEILTIFEKELEGHRKEDFTSFIENYFGYKLPWGISGVIRIASKLFSIDDDDVCDIANYLPAMVKVGVPKPSASWAMMVGIPYRDLAIKISDKYEKDTTEPNLQSFQEWRSKEKPREIIQDFKVEDFAHEDVIRAFSVAATNPILLSNASIFQILPFETRIVGIYFNDEFKQNAKAARVKDKVNLVRDYGNKFDHNAVQLYLRDLPIGYLDKDLAQLCAVDIDVGAELEGEITRIVRGDIPDIFITIRRVSK
ncbi:MAG: DEAD/DEAH box helicase [Candidatus Thorarchaeota archaeon]